MQRAETRLCCIAKIEVVLTGTDGQQGRRGTVRGGARTRTTGQVHALRLRQQRRQQTGIAFGVGQAFATAVGAGAGDHSRQWLSGIGQQAQLVEAFDHLVYVVLRHVRQQQALPRRETQLSYTAQHGRVEAAEWRHACDVDKVVGVLRMRADVQIVRNRQTLPTADRFDRQACSELLKKRPHRQFIEQMAHARLLGPRQFEEQLQHRDHQRMAIFQRHRPDRAIGRAPGQTKRQQRLAIALERRQPQVVGMFEHRQRFTAIELHGELGAQLVETWMALQRVEDLLGECAGVEAHLPVDPGGWAEHQIAHIIACGGARPESGSQQTVDQGSGLLADATDLQVGAIGRLNRPASELFGGIGHRVSLIGAD